MSKWNKFLNGVFYGITVAAILAFAWFVHYGLKTQCPDVAIYVYCGWH